MAAVGMGGGKEWVPVDRNAREALMLEAVKIAVESGSDLNTENAFDSRTALDAARALRYNTVIKYLEEKGAKGGKNPAPARGAAAGSKMRAIGSPPQQLTVTTLDSAGYGREICQATDYWTSGGGPPS